MLADRSAARTGLLHQLMGSKLWRVKFRLGSEMKRGRGMVPGPFLLSDSRKRLGSSRTCIQVIVLRT
jgi:hypothetical protein